MAKAKQYPKIEKLICEKNKRKKQETLHKRLQLSSPANQKGGKKIGRSKTK